MTQPKLFMESTEVSAKLRVHVQVVYELIHSQRLAAVNVSRSGKSGRRPIWRISSRALQELCEGGPSARPQPPAPRSRAAGRPPPAIVGPRARR